MSAADPRNWMWAEACAMIERAEQLHRRFFQPGLAPAAEVMSSLDEILEGKRAVVIGPGFGKDDVARSAVQHVLGAWEGPTVFDADALSLEHQPTLKLGDGTQHR